MRSEFALITRAGDEDIVEDIDAVRDALAKDVVLMSSFDVYKREIMSGNLEWTPVHRSEKFWYVPHTIHTHTHIHIPSALKLVEMRTDLVLF